MSSSVFEARSRRGTRGLREFYQTLSDIFGVWWEFHKARLDSGDIAFSYDRNKIPFNVGREYDAFLKTKKKPFRPLEEFTKGAQRSLQDSWLQFLSGLGVSRLDIPYSPLASDEPFLNNYVRDLIQKAREMGGEYTQSEALRGNNYSIEVGGSAGSNTGAEIGTRIDAIFGDEFNPTDLVKVAKIGFQHFKDVKEGIGFVEDQKNEPRYELLNATTRLDTAMLKSFGYGTAVGCPVAIPISSQTKKFLQDTCGVVVERTVIEDFGIRIHQEVEPIRTWFSGIEQNAPHRINKQQRAILSGEIWSSVKACPVREGHPRILAERK